MSLIFAICNECKTPKDAVTILLNVYEEINSYILTSIGVRKILNLEHLLVFEAKASQILRPRSEVWIVHRPHTGFANNQQINSFLHNVV